MEFQKKQDFCEELKENEFNKQRQELEEIQIQHQVELKLELEKIQQNQLEPIVRKIEEFKRKQQLRMSKENSDPGNQLKAKVSQDMCVICLEKPSIIALRPCGHVCLCQKCSRKMQPLDCPICNTAITGTLKVYFP